VSVRTSSSASVNGSTSMPSSLKLSITSLVTSASGSSPVAASGTNKIVPSRGSEAACGSNASATAGVVISTVALT
jgi:hypothetical protein